MKELETLCELHRLGLVGECEWEESALDVMTLGPGRWVVRVVTCHHGGCIAALLNGVSLQSGEHPTIEKAAAELIAMIRDDE